ncbi:DUF1345 domain-containing protein [Chitinophaga silvatica]|uniref:DUF1345 domain-containing protein n=2 Tax=Chitinophaga silvatica TaxID=2282649 RepID=A0A3E1Y2X1_9BACT|nr:DUF1345 domain-containing protein [Chitinophaga silvatica]
MHPVERVSVSLGLALLVFALFYFCKIPINPLVFSVLLWDVFAISYITMGWIVFFSRNVDEIRTWGRVDDGNRVFVMAVVIIAAVASLVIVLLMLLSNDLGPSKGTYLPIAICGMLASWTMVHTTFAFHYADIYYDDDTTDKTKHAGGLIFPGEKNPDYIDFAYFSFVIGMTFQVSDVQISGKLLRRVVLFHGLMSFILNTFVLALTINLIAGLR